jgi:hypothetical protein
MHVGYVGRAQLRNQSGSSSGARAPATRLRTAGLTWIGRSDCLPDRGGLARPGFGRRLKPGDQRVG